MSLATYEYFVYPLLQVLCEHPNGLKAREAREKVAALMDLSPEQLSARLPSGNQTYFANRVGWAHDRLKRRGFSKSISRGYWCATKEGTKFLNEHPNGLSVPELKKLVWVDRTTGEVAPVSPQVVEEEESADAPPAERLEQAIHEIRSAMARDLMDQIMDLSPDFFESLVLDLLVRMGYGVSRSDFQNTGGTGDGGIDGIIALDRLGLQKVYVQAKRWKPKKEGAQANSVGRPEVQGFFGALAGRRATMGVFITTSHFTKGAIDYARSVSDSIILVDGVRLTELMMDHGVGVSLRSIKIPFLDTDYFNE